MIPEPLFFLPFCPLSAALFFGSLVPVAVEFSSGIIIPAFNLYS
jgi:cytochrome c-type biogenesis protein